MRGRMIGLREMGLDAALEDIWLPMDGDRVVDARRDAGGGKGCNDPIPVALDGDGVLVEDVCTPGRDDRGLDRQVGKGRVIPRRDVATTFGVALQLVQLAQP